MIHRIPMALALGGALFSGACQRTDANRPPTRTSSLEDEDAIRLALERIEAELALVGDRQGDLLVAVERLVGAETGPATGVDGAFEAGVEAADRRIVVDEVARLGAELRMKIATARAFLEEPEEIEYRIVLPGEEAAHEVAPPGTHFIHSPDSEMGSARVEKEKIRRQVNRARASQEIESTLEALERLRAVRSLDDLARWRAAN